jgi:hypothetical protein
MRPQAWTSESQNDRARKRLTRLAAYGCDLLQSVPPAAFPRENACGITFIRRTRDPALARFLID